MNERETMQNYKQGLIDLLNNEPPKGKIKYQAIEQEINEVSVWLLINNR